MLVALSFRLECWRGSLFCSWECVKKMVKISVFLVVSVLCAWRVFVAPAVAYAAEFTIRSLDVYPRGAKFTIEIPPMPDGRFETELPGAFDPDKVKPIDIATTDFRSVTRPRPNWVAPSLASLKLALDSQDAKVSRLTARKKSLEQALAMLENVRPSNEIKADELLLYINEAQNLRLKTEEDLSELDRDLVVETAKLNAMREEFVNLAPANSDTCVAISGRAPNTNNNGAVLIEAFTNWADWSPNWIINMTSRTGEIEANLFARIEQKTGLDYSGTVTLHTRAPDSGATLPKLEPLRVDIMPDEPPAAAPGVPGALYRAREMTRNAPFDGDMMAAEEMKFRGLSGAVRATLTDRAVTGKLSFAPDGVAARVPLGTVKFKGAPQLILVPDARSDAWLVASLDSVPDALIPGRAELMLDNGPAGAAHIPEYGLGQTRIPFGYVPLVRARKEPLVEKTGSSWFSGGALTGGYSIEVTNGLPEEREIIVRDRIPIPTDDRVKINVRRIEPTPERDDENRLTWKISLRPGETAKIVVDYEISYPSGKELRYR